MRFSTKVFLAVLLPALGLTLGLSVAFHTVLANATRAQYIAHYQSQTRQVAQTLAQLETTTDLFMGAAVRVLAERVRQGGLLSTPALSQLSTELGVTHLYIIDKGGVFLRATSEDPGLLPNAFSFCPHYQRMFSEGIPFLPTGLMPGIPALVPYKFLFLPSADGRYLLETAVRADFIGMTLRQTLSADSELISLALYAPNGASLGEFGADGHFSYERTLTPSRTFATETSMHRGRLQVTERVAASNPECCSCRQRGLIGQGEYHYYLRTLVSTRPLDAALHRLRWLTALLFSVGLLLSLLASRWLSRRLVARIDIINEQAHTIMRTGDLSRRMNLHDSDEVGRLAAQFDQMLAALQVKQGELIRLEKARVVIETTEQVVHDIRSPLAALDMLLRLGPSVREEKRILLRTAVSRIREISSNLLDQTKQLRGLQLTDEATAPMVAAEPVWTLLESIVAEKQHQYGPRTDVAIELLQPESAYPLFVAVNPPLLRRVLSNLIDNAVDAIVTSGRVEITATEDAKGQVSLAVRDNGRGIPDSVVPTLMEKGRTYGKRAGTGLGLYAAKQAVTSWHGELVVASELDRGTTVSVILPKALPPPWFVPEVVIPAGATVVIVDDDASIHEVWRTRFADLALATVQATIFHCYSFAELHQFCTARGPDSGPLVVLMDHEFSNADSSGLDCVACLGLSASSVLVTSHSEEDRLRQRCIALKIGLLPKSAAPFVPVRIESPKP